MAVINPGYIPMVDQLAAHFAAEGSISLQEFFTAEKFAVLQEQVMRSEFVHSNYVMSHQYYISHSNQEIKNILESEEVVSFIVGVIGSEIKEITVKPYYLTHRSFVLRKNPDKEQYAVIVDVSKDWQEGNGGDICFATETDTVIVPPTTNTITIVKLTSETEEFITYCNHYTKDKKRFLLKGIIEI